MKMKHWSIKEWHLALSSEKGKGSSGIPHSLHGLSFSLFSSFLLLSLFLLFFSRSFRSFFFFFSYHCATLHGNSTLAVGEAYTVWPCYFLIPLFCLVIQMLLLWCVSVFILFCQLGRGRDASVHVVVTICCYPVVV